MKHLSESPPDNQAFTTAPLGNLDPIRTMRVVIPSVTALTLGFEIILSSFFLSILGIKRR
jgi:hypothetical protein